MQDLTSSLLGHMQLLFASLLVAWLLQRIRNPALKIAAIFPATCLHELAHLTVALVTLSRPSLPSLWPRKVNDGYITGSVTFRPGWLTAAFVALAPPFAAAAYWLLLCSSSYAGYGANAADSAIAILMGAEILLSSIPSKADWQIAVSYPISLLAMIGIVGLALT